MASRLWYTQEQQQPQRMLVQGLMAAAVWHEILLHVQKCWNCCGNLFSGLSLGLYFIKHMTCFECNVMAAWHYQTHWWLQGFDQQDFVG
jgi:hypothetical protein